MGIAIERIESLPDINCRTVLFEKYKQPSLIVASKFGEKTEEDFPLDNDDDDGLFSFLMSLRRRRDVNAQIEWHDENGSLHNSNDMPASIVMDDSNFISLKWFKHGIPYRKKSFYNSISILKKYGAYNDPKVKHILNLECFNQKYELHSFDGMPAKITDSTVEWFWNGVNCRMSYHEDLPCFIDDKGNMSFCKHKGETPTHIKGPIASKHYGKVCLKELNKYEKYVSWPIRKILTL